MPVLEHQRRRQLGGQAQDVLPSRREEARFHRVGVDVTDAFVQRQAAGIAGERSKWWKQILSLARKQLPYTPDSSFCQPSLSVSPSLIPAS